jgi:excisionase family DNA binding protein
MEGSVSPSTYREVGFLPTIESHQASLRTFRASQGGSMAGSGDKLLIGIRELSELTGIEIGTLYHWAAAGRVPCIRLSARCLRFRRTEIEAWLARHSLETKQTAPMHYIHTPHCSERKKVRYDK